MSELPPQGGGEGYGACDDADQIAKRENYVSYIAQRPRAEHVGAHGLFGESDDPLALSRELFSVADENGGKLPNRVVLFCDELGTMPAFDILPLFSAGRSLQMMEGPLMTPDELKSIPKGQFVVIKTWTHPMQIRLRLFLEWGISFGDPCLLPERAARTVAYASKQELEQAIFRCHHAQQTESNAPPAPPSSWLWRICAKRN